MIYPGMLLNNRYRVIRQMGEGGFGKTFEVDDSGKKKVLKVLLITYHKAVSLFEREAKVLTQLDHPGIPRVEPDSYFKFQPHVGAKPLHCFVMEKIDGYNLEEWISNNGNQPIKQEQAINWLKQLVDILDIVHQQQYFHRDIKPENIMLKPNEQLVLIDFGAVRQITDTYLVKIGCRQEGTQVGTSGYMPIEQVDGVSLPQSDFFALGRTFVYLLTGKHPSKLMNYQTGELIWRDSATQILPEFADLIDWMMAPFPGNRPANTQVILQSLDGIGKGLPFGGQVSYLPDGGLDAHQTRSQNVYPTKPKSIRVKVGLVALTILGIIGWRLLSPQIAVALLDRGYENYEIHQFNEAKYYYKMATFLDPKSAEIRYFLALLYEDTKQVELAKNEYKIAVQGKFEKAYNNLARLYIIDSSYDDAIALLTQGLQTTENEAVKYNFLKNLGWAWLKKYESTRNKRFLKFAKTNLKAAIKIDSDRAVAHCLLAQVLEHQKDTKISLIEWKTCYDNTPREPKLPENKIWYDMARERL